MLSINGRMRLRRVRWHCQEEGSETPIDRLLDEAESTLSEGVREMACRLNQDASSFQKAAENLKRTAHVEVSKETLRQLVEGEGKAVLKAMQRAELMPDWSAEDCVTSEQTTRVYAGCDGVKVPLVTDEEKKKRRQGIRDKRRRRGRKCKPLPRAKTGADCAYKDFKVGYLYDESKQHKLVGVTSGNHEAAGRMLRRMSDQVGLSKAQERIALVDGAPWIRNQFEFHGLVDAIGLDFAEHQGMSREEVIGFYRAKLRENPDLAKEARENFTSVMKDQSTPEAMNALLEKIFKQEILDQESCEYILEIMLGCETGEGGSRPGSRAVPAWRTRPGPSAAR